MYGLNHQLWGEAHWTRRLWYGWHRQLSIRLKRTERSWIVWLCQETQFRTETLRQNIFDLRQAASDWWLWEWALGMGGRMWFQVHEEIQNACLLKSQRGWYMGDTASIIHIVAGWGEQVASGWNIHWIFEVFLERDVSHWALGMEYSDHA